MSYYNKQLQLTIALTNLNGIRDEDAKESEKTILFGAYFRYIFQSSCYSLF